VLGSAGLPDAPPPMRDLADYPLSFPCQDTAPAVQAGGMRAGIRFGSVDVVMTAAIHAQSLWDSTEKPCATAASRFIGFRTR
jgi:hypothetical protein